MQVVLKSFKAGGVEYLIEGWVEDGGHSELGPHRLAHATIESVWKYLPEIDDHIPCELPLRIKDSVIEALINS